MNSTLVIMLKDNREELFIGITLLLRTINTRTTHESSNQILIGHTTLNASGDEDDQSSALCYFSCSATIRGLFSMASTPGIFIGLKGPSSLP